MGIPVLIIGRSGTGKSTSIRNFPEAGVINVLGKPLPFKGAKNQCITTDNYEQVANILYRCNAKSIVIDDSGYLMTNQFMRGHAAKGAGNAIFTFYNDLADRFWGLIRFVVERLPADKTVYFIMHEDKNDFGDVKPKSIGKMLDEKVCLEGMFTVVLRSILDNGRYIFKTKTDGTDVCKTPLGMFDELEIDNDLKVVDDTIREYYNLNDNESEEKENE